MIWSTILVYDYILLRVSVIPIQSYLTDDISTRSDTTGVYFFGLLHLKLDLCWWLVPLLDWSLWLVTMNGTKLNTFHLHDICKKVDATSNSYLFIFTWPSTEFKNILIKASEFCKYRLHVGGLSIVCFSGNRNVYRSFWCGRCRSEDISFVGNCITWGYQNSWWVVF